LNSVKFSKSVNSERATLVLPSEVDQLELGVAAPTGLVHHPASDRLASAPGEGASEDDADVGHGPSCVGR
jgi:hypothetical protein